MDITALKLPARIISERLYLRFYNYEDSGWYYEMAQRNKEHLLRFEPGNAVFCIHDEGDAEAMMDHFEDICRKRKELYLGVFLREGNGFVGQLFLALSKSESGHLLCSLGFFADVAFEGKGYMTEAVQTLLHFAFTVLQAEAVTLECDAGNVRSARLAVRCGFVEMKDSNAKPSEVKNIHYKMRHLHELCSSMTLPQYRYT